MHGIKGLYFFIKHINIFVVFLYQGRLIYFFKHIIMKEVNEEELYPLSGWDSIEENQSYSDIFIKKLQQHI